MQIAITGGSGFLGKRLISSLEAASHTVRMLGRSRPAWLAPQHAFFAWDAMAGAAPSAAIDGVQAVIHLAGEPVAQRWTAAAKDRMWRSRVEGTNNLLKAIEASATRPPLLISASAVGYYGFRGEELLVEDSAAGTGFLPELSVAWEKASQAATRLGVRVVNPRIGIVLGVEGGALQQMLPPFRMGVGGRIGDGRQWMSWIHVDDMIGLLLFYLAQPDSSGPVNATAPKPVRNSEFTEALGRVLHRPAILPVPGFALRILFGEMAAVILGSQRVEPARALRDGYRFLYPELAGALENLLATRS
ncbi:MAG: TIGR01777 family oxidoreductase [Bryobacteraceae bacterium]|nr:TIGR01777 family oxidoreductase [Bryobacteraceae bacterium]